MSGMDTGTAAVGAAQAGGEQVTRSDGFEWLARAGLVARGVVYVIIGLLSVKVALGSGGETTNQQGALKEIAQQPFGKVLLALMAIGLFGYAVWRLLRAIVGHGPEAGDDTKDRVAGVVSGIAYAALCVTALSILFGSGSGGGSGNPDKTTGGVLGWPGGQVLVGLAGLIFIGVAADQVLKGVKQTFLEDAKTGEMDRRMRQVYTAVGTAGHVARGVVFALIGWFLVRAAIEFDPDKAVSLDGALAKLGDSSFGPVALGVVAAGLIAFGAFSILDGRYRRV
jgi:hypothetical protein